MSLDQITSVGLIDTIFIIRWSNSDKGSRTTAHLAAPEGWLICYIDGCTRFYGRADQLIEVHTCDWEPKAQPNRGKDLVRSTKQTRCHG